MTRPNYVAVPRALLAREFNGYSDSAAKAKDAFHKNGLAFLKKLAAALDLPVGTYDVRSNPAGIAVSGEVTLHSDDIYIQIGGSFTGPGLLMLYRSCSGRRDYTGGTNQYAKLTELSGADNQARLVRTMQDLIARERQRKAQTAQTATH
jgi:hypothetical protein